MNTDFIVDGLENFANWGGPIADILGALGDIFGDDGLGALQDAETGEAGEGASLSSGLSSDSAEGAGDQAGDDENDTAESTD